jgi:hypothetical protein
VVDQKARWEIKMGMIWRTYADMRNQEYDMSDWIWITFYKLSHPPDWESYLSYPEWKITLLNNLLLVPVHQADLPHLLSSLSFSFSINSTIT